MVGFLVFQKKLNGLEKNELKILVFRSIRPEEMGYVILDICKEYGNELDITILTNKQNIQAMKNIENVKKTITYSGNNFEYYPNLKNEIKRFSEISYNLIIIPTNGNLETYENIYEFVKKYFSYKEINYYIYPQKFIIPSKMNLKIIIKKILKKFIFFVCLPITTILLSLFYLISLINK